MEIKPKINKWDWIKPQSFCTKKETIKNKKTTCGMGENICNQCDWQGINFSNIKTVCTSQYPKNKQSN